MFTNEGNTQLIQLCYFLKININMKRFFFCSNLAICLRYSYLNEDNKTNEMHDNLEVSDIFNVETVSKVVLWYKLFRNFVTRSTLEFYRDLLI